MADRGKVIKGLVCCCSPTTYDCTNRCPYATLYKPGNGYKNCMAALLPDALALLKEQEPVHTQKREFAHMWFWCCGSCGVAITEGDKFCRNCGIGVKWDE